jgi:PAS domain S-box-containing protein
LGHDAWECRRELIFALELHRAECELLSGQLAVADHRLTMLSSRAANTVELATITCLRVDLYTILDRSDRAVGVCLEYLRHLNIEWSPHPTKDEVRREYDRIWSRLGDRAIEELIEKPLMSDPTSLATLDVLTKVVSAAYFTDENLSSLVICKMVNLSLEHGNSDGSCFAYVWLGVIAGPRFNNYKAGFRFGRLGYELVEKRGLKRFQARTYMCFGNMVMPWTRHVRTGRDLVRRAFDTANKVGDLTFAAYSCNHLITNLLAAGDQLAEVQREAEKGLEFVGKVGFGLIIDDVSAQLGLVRSLRGLTTKFGSFNDQGFDELRFEQHLSSDPVVAEAECWYSIRKLQARVFAGDYVAAVGASLKAQPLLWTSPSQLETAEFHFYSALAHAASCDSAVPDQAQQHSEALAAHHSQLEIWAEHCPENFENRAALVAAEIARIEGRALDAERLYEQAIRSARENGFVHNEALAYEIAARFYAVRGFDKIADTYLRDARYSYLRWGADGKVKQLDHLYPHLKKQEPAVSRTSTIMAPGELLDLGTVIKVSQAISGEMVLEKLIDRIMRVAIEHAGAERGLLIIPRGHELQIEAEATTKGDDVTVHMRDASAAGVGLPESLVRYVTRTHESVILDDASSQNGFSTDPYILQRHTRSVLCLPLMNQAKLTGVLYLENNLVSHVFTPERITVLKVLASQAAITLENTRLYHDLEDREAKIRRLVDANVLGIVFWNLEGAIVGANEAFLSMVEYSREDLVAGCVRWTDLTPDEWRERDEQAIADLTRTGTVQPFEKEYFRKDGTRVPVLFGSAMFEGNRNEGVAFVLDLSEQKRAEGEIRALKDQLYRENLALRDAFREISELKEKLVQEKLYLEQEIRRDMDFGQIVGNSPALRSVLQLVETVGPSDSTVLLLGETGTGKELIARAIHDRSGRKDRTFVKVNCAAIPTGLLESELFGHEKGAFTGAVTQRIGRLELADQGTLFLDEVGDIPTEIQPKLLRALQEREFERLGSTRTRKVNVRLIAATNRDLEKMVAAREFRSDLYYRLNVFPIRIPPLRERKGDIPVLVSYFVQKFAKQMQKKIDTIPAPVMRALTAWGWPGNIRELENFIERAVILTRGSSLEARLRGYAR